MILTVPLAPDHPAVTAQWKCPRCGKFFEAGDVTTMLESDYDGVAISRLMCHSVCADKAKQQRERAIAAARPGRYCTVCGAAIEQPGARVETMELCWVCARLKHSATRESAENAIPDYLKAED